MRRALLWCSVPVATLAAALAACGGSSSETPWPAEPSPAMIAPVGEAMPVAGDEDAGARRRKE